jgi:hypothetical protein
MAQTTAGLPQLIRTEISCELHDKIPANGHVLSPGRR